MTAGYLGRGRGHHALTGAGRWRPRGRVGAFLHTRTFWPSARADRPWRLAVAPAAIDYAGTGHIDPATHHWSRFFAMSFAFSLAFILTRPD